MSLEDPTSETHWLCVAEMLAGDLNFYVSANLMAIPTERGHEIMLPVLFFLDFFLPVLWPRSSGCLPLSNLVLLSLDGIQRLFFFSVDTNTKPLSQHSILFV